MVARREVHRAEAGILLVGRVYRVGLDDGRLAFEGKGAVGHVEASGKACGINLHVADAAAQRVHHQHGGRVGHIEVHVEGLADAVLNIHVVAGRE